MKILGILLVLSELLAGALKPTIVTQSEMDSIFRLETKQPKNEDALAHRWTLEYENKQQVYRHSFMADYYVVDHQRNTRTQIGGGPVRDAHMSPNGRYVVYSKNNNLYIYKLDFSTEVEITNHNGLRQYTDADNHQHQDFRIFNGVSDWMYEEEFGVTRLFEFSPDSKQIAFIRLDAQNVPRFEWQEYLGKDDKLQLYPATQSLRYPKCGEQVAKAVVCVYDIYYKTTKVIPLPQEDGWYIPRIKWNNPVQQGKETVEAKLIIERVNRDQNVMEVYAANARSTASQMIAKEQSDKYYVDYSLFDQWIWLKDNRFVKLSEQSGWKALYLCTPNGGEISKLTEDGSDVTAVYGADEATGWVYYQAAPTPLTRQCYAVSLKKGISYDLTYEDGIHKMTFSPDYHHAIEFFESVDEPGQYSLHEVKGNKLTFKRIIEDNAEVKAKWEHMNLPHKQFFTFKTERGDELNAWRILPTDFDSTKTYPAVLMQYSGPGSQQVLNRWRKAFGHYLASQGYVVINADPRGTNARGRKWRNETYMHLGTKEAEDQLSTARYAASLPYVDAERIAIIGWSYGGYQTIRAMSEQDPTAPILKCGIAIAPVTDWRLYDAAYTERFMRRPQVNAAGYNEASLLNKADKLTGNLLIIHGLADDNVHAQNTLLYTDALVQAGKQFDMQVYTDDNHFLRKRGNYLHVHERILRFLKENL